MSFCTHIRQAVRQANRVSFQRYSFQLQQCRYSSQPVSTSSTSPSRNLLHITPLQRLIRHLSNSFSRTDKRPKITVHALTRLYKGNVPIAMMTAHDYPSAIFVENSGMEMCLVGDSLGMVALGYDSTTQVTMQDMIHHCKAVSRGAKSPFLVGDMPFGSFEASEQSAVENAVRIIKEGGMEAVKIEGGLEMCSTIKKIASVGIPVMGHIGLTPQRQANLGGYRVQGKTAEKGGLLLEDALSLQSAGCFAIVLEAIPAPVSTYITQKLNVPTIGIGAGPGCSGQVLVQQDMLGSFDRFVPRFCKQYENLTKRINVAMKQYRDEVKGREYPAEQHCYPMADGEEEKFKQMVEKWERKD